MPTMKHHNEPWLGEWLNNLRIAKGMPVSAVASALDVNASTVARRECADQRIVADDLPSILAAYGVTPKQLADKLREMMP